MRRVILLAVLAAGSAAAEPLSPEDQALIAPVHQAFVQVEEAQSRLPPPKTDAERLIRLGQIDQAAREGPASVINVDLSSLAPPMRAVAYKAMWDEITAHDLADQAALKTMIPPEGWFTISRYGKDAVDAAFLIVQHAVNDRPLQGAVLAAMKPLAGQGEASRIDYAMLYDRYEVQGGRPQLYATQLTCKDHRWVLEPLIDPAHADARRKAMGFLTTAEENFARFANAPPCGG